MSEIKAPVLIETESAVDVLHELLAEKNIPIFDDGEDELILVFDLLSKENQELVTSLFPNIDVVADGEHAVITLALETEGTLQILTALEPQSLEWLAIDTSMYEDFDPDVYGWMIALDGRCYTQEIGERQNAWFMLHGSSAVPPMPVFSARYWATPNAQPLPKTDNKGFEDVPTGTYL